MSDIDDFITQAREKNLSDDAIKTALKSQGWSEDEISIALSGLVAPTKNTDTPVLPIVAPDVSSTHKSSLSPLMAALHHVLLWFFTGSSSIAIVGAVASLMGNDISTNVLASMLAVTLITFIPYAVLFSIFLAKNRKQPLFVPSKVWSIITICLHSIGSMAAAITLVVSLITDADKTIPVSAGLILFLDFLVVITYIFAAFGTEKLTKLRTIIITIYLPLLIIMFGTLVFLSLLQLGPAKHDEQLRKDMVSAVKTIHSDATTHQKIPDTPAIPKAITYKKKTSSSYEICGTFQTKNGNVPPYEVPTSQSNYDDYVYEENFMTGHKGQSCFTFTVYALEQNQPSTNQPVIDDRSSYF